jgi:hypothetical protein
MAANQALTHPKVGAFNPSCGALSFERRIMFISKEEWHSEDRQRERMDRQLRGEKVSDSWAEEIAFTIFKITMGGAALTVLILSTFRVGMPSRSEEPSWIEMRVEGRARMEKASGRPECQADPYLCVPMMRNPDVLRWLSEEGR